MAYDEELTEISRDQLGFMDGVSEKNMMGEIGGPVEIEDDACDDQQLKGLVSFALSFITQLLPIPVTKKLPKPKASMDKMTRAA